MFKRAFDFLASASALMLLSPVMLILAAMVHFKLGSPVIFRQERPGLNAVPFHMLKFRTMREAVNESGNPLPDPERMTAFGLWLRSTSLDELPELWNVLKGDMSLVGPRPLLMMYLPRYSAHQARRHAVRPGLTGWAQVNGRNALRWEEKFDLDVWYVDNRTWLLDIKILFLTVRSVVMRKDIAPGQLVTMTEFRGSLDRLGGPDGIKETD